MARKNKTTTKTTSPSIGEAGVGDRRRRDLVEAAYALIAEHGLEGLRTRDIAARAGVNISTLHYYFGTKQALIVAVLNRTREMLTAAAMRQPAARGWRVPSVEAELVGTWQAFVESPHLTTVLQELALLAQRDPTTRAAVRQGHRGWNAHVEAVLAAGIQSGNLRKDLDPELGARIITAFTIGAMTQLGVDPDVFDFGDAAAQIMRWLGDGRRGA